MRQNMTALDPDFFFKNKAAFDDENLFHHRQDRCFALLSNRRYCIDGTIDRPPIDLHAFMIQHIIDYALTLIVDDA
jgi:hypothetical protein